MSLNQVLLDVHRGIRYGRGLERSRRTEKAWRVSTRRCETCEAFEVFYSTDLDFKCCSKQAQKRSGRPRPSLRISTLPNSHIHLSPKVQYVQLALGTRHYFHLILTLNSKFYFLHISH